MTLCTSNVNVDTTRIQSLGGPDRENCGRFADTLGHTFGKSHMW